MRVLGDLESTSGGRKYYMLCVSLVIQVVTMATTKTLNVRISESQHEELDALVERGDYVSKGEFIRELLRDKFDDFSSYLHEKATTDRDKHTSLEEYGKSRGLE